MKVMYNANTQRVPIKAWVEELYDIEPKAIGQLKNLSNLPFVYKHIACMPDVHFGYGATVGSVIATKNAVVPAAVGVDIGCGMMAVKTDLDHRVVRDKIKEIRHSIERSVPVGFNKHKEVSKRVEKWKGWWGAPFALDVVLKKGKDSRDMHKIAQHQMGTLGGGNHFIEICVDTPDSDQHNVWVMLHSGSRNVGKTFAERFIHDAKGLMKEMFIHLPDPDLAYYVPSQPQYQEYLNALTWCQEYAMQNRVEMMNMVLKDLGHAVTGSLEPIKRLVEVNCHHNYAEMENHFGENVLVTRKGAVRAREGDMGIIPGSMGTKSFIVRGLGNPDSFHSCSHGAGRRMSRTEAKATFTVDDLAEQTAGVECRKDAKVVDEIPGAYKPIDEVMNNQKDLVEVVATLKQIACVKG